MLKSKRSDLSDTVLESKNVLMKMSPEFWMVCPEKNEVEMRKKGVRGKQNWREILLQRIIVIQCISK